MIKEVLWNIIFSTVSWILILREKMVECILNWYFGDKKISVPPLTNQNLFLARSATQLAKDIRERKLTSYQLVSATIERMIEVNTVLNAIVDGPFAEEALAEAKRIDEKISAGLVSDNEFSQKPFLGAPFTIKDSTAVAGKLQTFGVSFRMAKRSKEDAECIRMLKTAGAIIVATTNIPDGMWLETRNMLIGQTNNPYDTRRTTGGSSGGDAALISTCSNCLSVSTDLGGSLRMAAYYCGIYGHYPTPGIVSTRGNFSWTGEEDTMCSVGPIARNAIDLLPILNALIKPSMRTVLKLNQPVDIRKLKYYYIRESRDIRCTPVSPELQEAMTKVVNHFKEMAEMKPIEIKLEGSDCATKLWRYWMTLEPNVYDAILGDHKRLNPIIELGKKLIGASDLSVGALLPMIDELLPSEDADKDREITTKCYDRLSHILADDGILLYHSMTRTAPFHYALLTNVSDFGYSAIMNVLRVPSTQVPLGLDSKGLPLGIQVVASQYRDRHCLAVAEELERVFGGWKEPF